MLFHIGDNLNITRIIYLIFVIFQDVKGKIKVETMKEILDPTNYSKSRY